MNSENLGGAGSDGILTYEELQNIESINIKGTPEFMIKSLEGIEYFFNLESLAVTYTAIENIDLTKNTHLSYLNCSYNRLKSLNINGLNELISLNCEFNYLTGLDMGGCVNLETVYIKHNLLSKVDFSDNTKLKFIETFDNILEKIDVSMLKDLEFLHVDHNRLTKLDMSKNLNLKGGGFVVRNNDVREIILPDIPGFTVYYDDFAEQNPIAGYERLFWYSDKDYLYPIEGDIYAEGQTLYGKRIPNDYNVKFNANGGTGAPLTLAAVLLMRIFLMTKKYDDNKKSR